MNSEQNTAKKQVDLLSPVGSFDALVAAVSNGADAVYLGSKLFNARRLAGNFNPKELITAVQYARLHKVKVYMTLNTLVKNSEIKAFLKQVSVASQLGVSAVILQDLSFAPIIKKHFPKMEVHASTQATLMNTEAIKYWMQYVDVFVLARELTKSQVKAIFDNTGAKLEVFVHGHLCISYSGQCLISSLIGSRSGNRGMCASSCRKQYNGDDYLLSAKDLCMIENVKDVVESGASTIKMEGRMKSAEYVATVTREYRKQLDSVLENKEITVTKEDYDDLKMAFNRNFTKGYFNDESKIVDPVLSSKRGLYLGRINSGFLKLEEDLDLFDGVVCVSHGERQGDFVKKITDVDGVSINNSRRGDIVKLHVPGFSSGSSVFLLSRHGGRILLGKSRVLPVTVNVDVKVGLKPTVKFSLMDKELSFELDFVAQAPKKHEFTTENWQTELLKYSSQIFSIDVANLNIVTDGSFVPKSEITKLRTELDSKLLNLLVPVDSNKLIEAQAPSFAENKFNNSKTNPSVHAQVYTKQGGIDALDAGADYIYYNLFTQNAEEIFKDLKNRAIDIGDNQKVCAFTPMVLVDKDLQRIPELVKTLKPDSLMVQNVGVLNLNIDIPMILGYQMNVFNDHQLSSYIKKQDSSVVKAVASIELTSKEIGEFANKNRLLYYVHGRPIVMTFNERVANGQLRDQRDYSFPLRKGPTGSCQMLYSKTIGMLQHTPDILKLGVAGLFLDLEKGSDVIHLVNLYKQFAQGRVPQVQNFKRGVTVANLEKGVM
ncbi:U32 family peptidase [archaeon]|jgi:U32 family peptidase|nr:U32 family peptidase [archaeon]